MALRSDLSSPNFAGPNSLHTPVHSSAQLPHIIQNHHVVFCVGSGGVGKTTTSAAIGLLAAQLGKRVLCLTIDPARRLAQSFGLDAHQSDTQIVSNEQFRKAGIEVTGSLTVMMLNTKRTFDELVTRYAKSQTAREQILNNRIYHYISTSLAGTRDYMAIEKLHEVKHDPNYDLIVLDTPPTSHAIDFLMAPERLIDAVNNSAVKWLIRAFRSSDRLSFDILARSASIAMQAVGKFTGQGFLEQVSELLCNADDMFGDLAQRAGRVQQLLRADDVAYVLVTSPCPMAINEVLYLSDGLLKLGISSDAFVVNYVHPWSLALPADQSLRACLKQQQLPFDHDFMSRVRIAAHDMNVEAARERASLQVLDDAISSRTPRPARITVPAFAEDVHDLQSLQKVVQAFSETSK